MTFIIFFDIDAYPIGVYNDNGEVMQECCKKKVRSKEEKDKLLKRLNIIEGQVRGVKQMINDDRYCNDILIQIAAITKSLKSLSNTMLKSHIKECVVNDLKHDNLEIIDELLETVNRFN